MAVPVVPRAVFPHPWRPRRRWADYSRPVARRAPDLVKRDATPRATDLVRSDRIKADRELRYRMRHLAQRETTRKVVRCCGRYPALGAKDTDGRPQFAPNIALAVDWKRRRPYFTGLTRCNSVHECPVCAPRIQRQRVSELEELNGAHFGAGGRCYLATLTVQHYAGHGLAAMRRHIAKSWQRTIAGAPWKRTAARLGVMGTVRALEVTHGSDHGWHPHLHCAVYVTRAWSDTERVEFARWLAERWRRYIARPVGGKRVSAIDAGVCGRPSLEHGVVVEPLGKSEYLAKMGLAYELTAPWTKDCRPGHRTPWQILRDMVKLAAGADETRPQDREAYTVARALWAEYARAMVGAKQLTGLTAMRRRYDLGPVVSEDAVTDDRQTDLELSGEGDSLEVVRTFTLEEWRAVTRSRSSVLWRLKLLDAVARPRHEWADRVQKILEAAQGFDPVPF